MTCKDCLHSKVCRDWWSEQEENLFSESNIACRVFTDRSEYTHLPCNIGKTVYFIRDGKIIETVVEKIVIKKNGTYLKLSCNTIYETSCKSIGKTVFFDREEAEKVIERVKENEENTITEL